MPKLEKLTLQRNIGRYKAARRGGEVYIFDTGFEDISVGGTSANLYRKFEIGSFRRKKR